MSGYEMDILKINQPSADGILSGVQAMQKQQEEAAKAKAANSPFGDDTFTISHRAQSTYKSQSGRFEDSENSPGRSMNASEASELAKRIGEAQAEMLAADTGTGGDAENIGGDTGTGGDTEDDNEAENTDAAITTSANDDATSLGTKGIISDAESAVDEATAEKIDAVSAALEQQTKQIEEQIEKKEAQIEALFGEHNEGAMIKMEMLQQEVALLKATIMALRDPDKDKA